MSRGEALQYAQAMLTKYQVDPALMEELRAIIPQEETLVIWLASNNGWLGGDPPLLRLNDRELLLDAARKAMSMDHWWGSDDQWRGAQQQESE
jgi:hypothetical protein